MVDLEHVPRVALCSGIVCTKFKLNKAIRSWNVTIFWCQYAISCYDLDLWPVDLESLWSVWGNVVIVCGKFDRNRTIPGWVIHNLANFGPCYLTLWHWPLTPWSWTCMVGGAACDQSMFQIWTRSVDQRLSYWRLTSDFSFVFRRCSPTIRGDLKNAWTDLHQTWCDHCQVIATHAV